MKFTGIAASLAVASSASALAIPQVQSTLDQVTGTLSNVDNLVSGLLGGNLGQCAGLDKVTGQLKEVQGVLQSLVPSQKRGVTDAVEGTVGGVVGEVGNVASPVTGLVGGVVKRDGPVGQITNALPVGQVTDLAGTLVQGITSGALDQNGLTSILGGLAGGQGQGILSALGGGGGLTSVLGVVGL